MEIKNKNVIVTGAASGVGKELTKQLLSKGAFVAALDINEENLKLLKDELKTDKLKIYVVDVSNSESIANFKNAFDKDFDKLDILINNAGIIQPFVHVSDLDDKTINRVMNINFFGPLNLIRAFLKDLIDDKKEHFIVNVSSMGGFFPFPGQTIYGSSKAALKILTEGLYAELKDTDIHTMVVLPGAMNTNISQNSNVEVKGDASTSNVKMLSANDAASQIISGIEKNKFKLFLGSDAKFLKFLYKLNSRWAINFINKKMSNL